VIDAHRRFLSDRNRVAAYRRALDELVTPDSTVLDLGSGTGIMGLLACAAGAAEVYAVEATGMVGLAREICRANGYSERMHFIRGLSTDVELPGPVDIIVTDQINEFCFGAGLLEFLSDASARCLAPDGVTVPGAVDLLVAPVESAELGQEIEFWTRPVEGFDLSAVVPIAANQPRPFPVRREHLLGRPAAGATIDAAQSPEIEVEVRARVPVEKSGRLDGIAGFFAAHLAPGVVMTNDPTAADAIDRWGQVFPVHPPIQVDDGEVVVMDIRVNPGDDLSTWSASVEPAPVDGRRPGHARSERSGRGSSFLGRLLSSEDLDRSRSDHRPVLTRRAATMKTVLGLCDGQHTIADIEAEIARRHPAPFENQDAAARIVAELVAKYCGFEP
jgi:hypothetical protein